MKQIFRVSIHGRTLESRNLQRLLARAVAEKRNMDRVFRFSAPVPKKVEGAGARYDGESNESGASVLGISSPLLM